MSEKYFLGAMTRSGFSTEMGQLMAKRENYTYILKGGPGTGKSSLMKKIAQRFEKSGKVTRFYCSSDPDSLDAVYVADKAAIVIDGTAPHIFDPKYPGVCQRIVDLGAYWDTDVLKAHTNEILTAARRNASLLDRANRYRIALTNVCEDSKSCADSCIDSDKLDSFTARFMKKLLPKKGSGKGRLWVRQLSAVTEFGLVTLTDTLSDYPDVYILEDDCFACSHRVISAAVKLALDRGYDAIACPAHVFDNTVYEHLLIPEAGVALVSRDYLRSIDLENAKPVRLARFYDKQKMSRYTNRLKLNKLTARGLCEETCKTIRSAKEAHDELEKYYIAAMDHKKLDKITEKLLNEIQAE